MSRITTYFISAFLLLNFGFANAADSAKAKQLKVVIQVSSDDAQTHEVTLNNTANLQKHFGADNITIEIVAYGPGLSILTKKNKFTERVASLATQEITLSACGNTIANAAKKNNGVKPELTAGVRVVPSGIARIVELQSQGYAYVRP